MTGTLSHIPLSKGGVDEIYNIVTCCKTCNKYKGDSLLENYEEIVIKLLHKAVEDKMIIGKNLNIDNETLKEELLKVDRLESITDIFIFQSKNYRFHIKDGFVTKVIVLVGLDEYNNNISREN